MEIIDGGLFALPDGKAMHYAEHLRVPALSVGTYSMAAGGTDPQSPHTEDEIYVVVSGRASFTGGGSTVPVASGTILYVPAHEEHRFHDVMEPLTVLVLFAPAEYSQAPES
jgi:mannose-6-phosphate isomerase-like protein (cupin superfamily)